MLKKEVVETIVRSKLRGLGIYDKQKQFSLYVLIVGNSVHVSFEYMKPITDWNTKLKDTDHQLGNREELVYMVEGQIIMTR